MKGQKDKEGRNICKGMILTMDLRLQAGEGERSSQEVTNINKRVGGIRHNEFQKVLKADSKKETGLKQGEIQELVHFLGNDEVPKDKRAGETASVADVSCSEH